MIKTPLKVEKCPLIDAIIEIRFSPKVDKNVVFPLIYGEIKDLFPGQVKTLSVAQIPEIIRERDSKLKYSPLFRIDNKVAHIRIGYNVVSIGSIIPYIGWSTLSKIVYDVLDKISHANVVDNILRIGHRYVNFFNRDITNDLNIKLGDLENYRILGKQIRYEMHDGTFMNSLQFSNTAQYNSPISEQTEIGSLLDIDTSIQYLNNNENNFDTNLIKATLQKAHDSEKQLFFSIINNFILNSLVPHYE